MIIGRDDLGGVEWGGGSVQGSWNSPPKIRNDPVDGRAAPLNTGNTGKRSSGASLRGPNCSGMSQGSL